MQLRLKVKVDFKALCLISAILGVVILICAAFYIHYYNSNYYSSKQCESDEEYRKVTKPYCTYRWYLTIAVGSVSLILSVLQIILALLIAFARPLSNSKCYVICHLVLGVIALIPFVILVVIITQAPRGCDRLEEALFTFLILDMFYCFLSAIIMCACGESLGCTRGKNLTLNNLGGGGGGGGGQGGGAGGYNQRGGGRQSHPSPKPDTATSPTPTAEPSQQHIPKKSEVKKKKKRSKKPSKPQPTENAAETKKSVETTKSNGAKKKNKKKQVEPLEEF